MGFDNIERNATRWPSPATIFEALPTYVDTYEPAPVAAPRIASDPERERESRERIDAMIRQCAERLK